MFNISWQIPEYCGRAQLDTTSNQGKLCMLKCTCRVHRALLRAEGCARAQLDTTGYQGKLCVQVAGKSISGVGVAICVVGALLALIILFFLCCCCCRCLC